MQCSKIKPNYIRFVDLAENKIARISFTSFIKNGMAFIQI